MNSTNEIVQKLKGIIKVVCDSGESYSDSEVKKIFKEAPATDLIHLKSEVEFVFQHEDLNKRFYALYLNSLLWFLFEKDQEFVLNISRTALTREDILNKEPWIALLEELDEHETIALFFKQNLDYGDRFLQEKLLYIVSETSIEIGDRIIEFLNSEYEIISSAAITVLEDQNLKHYRAEMITFFEKTNDPDLLLQVTNVLLRWDSENFKAKLEQKISSLKQLNSTYYDEVIEELNNLKNATWN